MKEPMRRPKVLIIDDDRTTCLLVSTALQQVGYEVSIALDGRGGFNKALSYQPHCLILDVILPDINGYAICRQLRVLDPKHRMPIIFISTKNTPVEQSYGLSLGADRYLAKPFTNEILVKTVWDVLPPQVRSALTLPERKTPGLHLFDLIPRQREDPTLFATQNPFSSSFHMNRQTRSVYALIDGQKTVHTLHKLTRLELPALIQILRTLLEQKRIEFYDREGKRIDDIPADHFQ